jgi:serine phosphatase RsbU (regulator of sigma subunit)
MCATTTLFFEETFGTKLDETTLATLREMGQRRTYPPQTVLCQQGEVENTFYIIVEGSVMAGQRLPGGEERMVGVLGANEYFGELGLLDDAPRTATCLTIAETTVIEITCEVFARIVERSPAVAFAITQRVLSALRHTDEQSIESLRKKTTQLEQAYADLKMAQEALVEKERMERELELAAQMQRSLLPSQLPDPPGFDFAARLEPARYVGGDLYNVIALDDDNVGVLIGDVADKGLQASLFMAITQTLFIQESRHPLSPGSVVQNVHRSILEVSPTSDIFVTAIYGVLHKPTRRFTYVRAGHERPLLYAPGREVEELPGDGRFLGVIQEIELEESEYTLQPGERLMLYSDGVTDALSPQQASFGKERLCQLLSDLGEQTASGIVAGTLEELQQWSRGHPPFDDITLVVVAVD